MAKRAPFTAQEERLQRLIRNAEQKIVELKGLVDTDRRVVAADILKVDDPAQNIRVSEGGSLALGNEGNWRVIDVLTVPVSHTGDTDETTVRETVLPANSMGPNGAVRVSSIWHADGVAVASQYLIYFGQTIAANRFGLWQAIRFAVDSRPLYVWNQGVTDAQLFVTDLQWMHTHSLSVGHPEEVAVDTTQDVSVYFRVKNFDVGTTAYLNFALVEALYRN